MSIASLVVGTPQRLQQRPACCWRRRSSSVAGGRGPFIHTVRVVSRQQHVALAGCSRSSSVGRRRHIIVVEGIGASRRPVKRRARMVHRRDAARRAIDWGASDLACTRLNRGTATARRESQFGCSSTAGHDNEVRRSRQHCVGRRGMGRDAVLSRTAGHKHPFVIVCHVAVAP